MLKPSFAIASVMTSMTSMTSMTLLLSACGAPRGQDVATTLAVAETPVALPAKATALYDYVRQTQIVDGANPRAFGTWPSYVTTPVTYNYRKTESNLFMALQMSLALHRLEAQYTLPGIQALDDELGDMLGLYVADVAATQEPRGSLAHWALYRTTDDKPIRYASVPSQSYATLRLFDIPNDLDTSSQAYLWAKANGREPTFRQDYLSMLGDWRDLGRRYAHRSEARWKKPESGAFLTWNERDKSAKINSRIPGGWNDVDCVVNLNVLTSLYEAGTAANLPAPTREGRDAACKLLVEAAQAGASDRCAVYYDETHINMAYARALHLGVDCLEPARDALVATTLALADRLAAAATEPDTVDLAETMLALKWLHPARTEARAEIEPRLAALERRLDATIRTEGDLSYVPEGALYQGTVNPGSVPVTGRWFSRAATNVYALEAMLTP